MCSWDRANCLALEVLLSSHLLICDAVWIGLSLVPLVVKVLPKPTWNRDGFIYSEKQKLFEVECDADCRHGFFGSSCDLSSFFRRETSGKLTA